MKLYIPFTKAFMVLSLMTGCAYRLGHQNREIPGGYKTVFVKMFTNSSNEPGAENSFTQAMMNELERSGFVTVTSKESAEIVIVGDILSIQETGAGLKSRFTNTDRSDPTNPVGTAVNYNASYFTNYRLVVNTSLKAVRASDEKVIWQTNLSGRRSFLAALLTREGIRSSNVLYNHSRKKQTMKLIAEDMMKEAFDRLTENF